MKPILLFFLLSGFFWQVTLPAASAQNPYPCDSLQVTCARQPALKVRYFQAPKSCTETCGLCTAVAKQDWQLVQNWLRKEIRSREENAASLPQDLRNRLLAHRLVNFVLPPPEATDAAFASLQLGFQVPHMTYTWNLTMNRKPARRSKPFNWKLSGFRSDGQIYSRLNGLGAHLLTLLHSDSLREPQPWLPDQNYLASWYGTRSSTELAALENQIKTNPEAAIALFTRNKDGGALVFLVAHQNLRIRYLALQALQKIQDKNCLPYLLYLAERTRQGEKTTPETEILYANFCEELVAAISTITSCNFNRCPFAHYPPQHYLTLGLPAWQERIDHLDPENQGIGSYVLPLEHK